MSPGNRFILGTKYQRSKSSHKNIAGVGLCTVVSAGVFKYCFAIGKPADGAMGLQDEQDAVWRFICCHGVCCSDGAQCLYTMLNSQLYC